MKRDVLLALIPVSYGLYGGWKSVTFPEVVTYNLILSLIVGFIMSEVLSRMHKKSNPQPLKFNDKVVLFLTPVLFCLLFSNIFGGILFFFKRLEF